MRLQRAAEEALRYGIDLAHANKSWAANGGAIVALDPRDGAVLAMASAPTFKPSLYVGRSIRASSRRCSRRTRRAAANYPGLNRAIAGLYPPGSTWKPVTALAGMQEHVFSAYESIRCTPFAIYGLDKQRFRNWNPYVDRPMTLPEALAESCDTYFYEIGNRFYEGGARRPGAACSSGRSGSGSERPTGLDIGGEADGLVPTPEWRKKTFESDWDRAWNPGDSIQLAIGQKDLLVTPLQMAAFYAMLANGGRIVTPYLVSDVEQPGGKGSPRVVLRRFAPPHRGRAASIRLRSRRFATASSSRRTRRAERRPGVFAQLLGADLGQDRERPRRSSRSPATRPATSRTSRGGAAGARPTTPASSSAH